MGDVIPIRPAQHAPVPDVRRAEANQLRRLINEQRVAFRSGESGRVAFRVHQWMDRHVAESGRRLSTVCEVIWPGQSNPAKRRRELLLVKKATKLLEYVERVARAVGAQADDMLLDVFRDTRFDEEVAARLAGRTGGPDVEDCWRIVSETLHKLACEVSRTEELTLHLQRLLVLQGSYDLADHKIRPARGPLLYGPLANGSAFYGEYAPIPSVILFHEPKSETVECPLTVEGMGRTLRVQVTVLREVRLAIGPADDVREPKPLFEFRSVLVLDGPDGQLRVRHPWHDLEDEGLTVDIDGAWLPAKIVLPKVTVEDAHFAELLGPAFSVQRFPAALEAPLQFEHHDIVWRPVTAVTCRDLLLRPYEEVAAAWPPSPPSPDNTTTACPPGTLGQALEHALLDGGPDGLPLRLRGQARGMSETVRAWHAERIGLAEAAHRDLRHRWEAWS